jgi:hypothetical protein
MSTEGPTPEEESDPIFAGRVERVIAHLSLAVAAGLIVLVGIRWNAYQWDFHMLYGAAKDFAAGVTPYRGYGLSYYHPPLMLYVYRLFTLLPEKLAVEVWYGLKLAALAGLFIIWHRDFVRLRPRASTVLFFILAYSAAVYADLVAGNVSIFEQLLLWFGFSQLLRGRYLIFALCVVIAAQVKLTPIFFAILLITVCEPRQWRVFFATVLGFFALFSFNYWLQPGLFRDFWTVMPKLDERGVECTSFLALVRDISDLALGSAFTERSLLDEVVFIGIAGAIGLLSLWAWQAYARRATKIDQRLLICFSCFVLVLISPRMKTYTYILLLAPTLYVFRSGNWRRQIPLAVAGMAVLVLFPQGDSLLPFRLAFRLFNTYLPLFATFAIWVAYLDVLRTQGTDGPTARRRLPSAPGLPVADP